MRKERGWREREREREIDDILGREEGYRRRKNERTHARALAHIHVLCAARYNPSGDYSVVSRPPILR